MGKEFTGCDMEYYTYNQKAWIKDICRMASNYEEEVDFGPDDANGEKAL